MASEDEYRISLEELKDSFPIPFRGKLAEELNRAYESTGWTNDALGKVGRSILGFVGAMPCRFWSPPLDNRQRKGKNYVWFDEHEYLIQGAVQYPLTSPWVPHKLLNKQHQIQDARLTFGKEGRLEVDARIKILFPWADKNLKSNRPVEVYADMFVSDEKMSTLLSPLIGRLHQGRQ